MEVHYQGPLLSNNADFRDEHQQRGEQALCMTEDQQEELACFKERGLGRRQAWVSKLGRGWETTAFQARAAPCCDQCSFAWSLAMVAKPRLEAVLGMWTGGDKGNV